MSVHVNCIKVEALAKDRTQYDVTDVSETVQVAAPKNGVTIPQAARCTKHPRRATYRNPPSCMKDSAQRARSRQSAERHRPKEPGTS